MSSPIKEIIDGGTGTGKTYYSIDKVKKLSSSFCYLAPCRQLVYESFKNYKEAHSLLSTGEIKVNSEDGSNTSMFGVYESFNKSMINRFDSIIIDEAHFLQDVERGEILNYIVENFKGNIFLVSATRNFKKIKGFEIKTLKPLAKFTKKEIGESEFFERVEAGEPSIIFRKYMGDCGDDGGVPIHAGIISDDRFKAQIDFTEGRISLVETTNVIAQGLNFPATNILIEYNEYDTEEIILQKIGRLGRFGLTDENSVLTYCLRQEKPRKIKKNKKINNYNKKNIVSYDKNSNFVREIKEIYKLNKIILDKIVNYLNEKKVREFEAPNSFHFLKYSSDKYELDNILKVLNKFDLDITGISKYNINTCELLFRMELAKINLKKLLLGEKIEEKPQKKPKEEISWYFEDENFIAGLADLYDLQPREVQIFFNNKKIKESQAPHTRFISNQDKFFEIKKNHIYDFIKYFNLDLSLFEKDLNKQFYIDLDKSIEA